MLKEAINDKEHSLEYLMTIIPSQHKDKVAHFLKWLVSYEILKKSENGKYFWNEKE